MIPSTTLRTLRMLTGGAHFKPSRDQPSIQTQITGPRLDAQMNFQNISVLQWITRLGNYATILSSALHSR